jgi:tetratricopeptide (TPR) repeat protein
MIGIVLMWAILMFVGARHSHPNGDPPPPRSDTPTFGHAAPVPTKDNVRNVLKDELEHLHHVVDKDPENPRALFQLAALLQDSHNNQEAANYYVRGLALNPDNNASRIDYSLCLHALGKTDEALTQNRIVLKHDPSNIQALFNIGALFANRGVRDSAVTYWTKLIAKHPGESLASQARENLSRVTGKVKSL